MDDPRKVALEMLQQNAATVDALWLRYWANGGHAQALALKRTSMAYYARMNTMTSSWPGPSKSWRDANPRPQLAPCHIPADQAIRSHTVQEPRPGLAPNKKARSRP